MTNTKHTGIIVSASEAEAWHATIRKIMADLRCTFEQAVNLYIDKQRVKAALD